MKTVEQIINELSKYNLKDEVCICTPNHSREGEFVPISIIASEVEEHKLDITDDFLYYVEVDYCKKGSDKIK